MRCVKCGVELERQPGPGRPPRYCGEACRRAAEYELRRIQRRLERLEDEAREWRPGRGWYPHDASEATARRQRERLSADIAHEEARLRELLVAQEGEVI